MKDFLDNELNVGDRVVGLRQATTKAFLFEGKVIKITEKMVRIKNIKRENGYPYFDEFLIAPYKVVKIKE